MHPLEHHPDVNGRHGAGHVRTTHWRLHFWRVALAFAQGAWAAPSVSGGGACGQHGEKPEGPPVVTLGCRLVPARR
jgi:hypothetical protein